MDNTTSRDLPADTVVARLGSACSLLLPGMAVTDAADYVEYDVELHATADTVLPIDTEVEVFFDGEMWERDVRIVSSLNCELWVSQVTRSRRSRGPAATTALAVEHALPSGCPR
jgi:hypothetical protein